MMDHYEIVQQLTADRLAPLDRELWLNDFALELGWRPSDQLDLPWAGDFANAHLIVEHGLENTAVISFLRYPCRFPDLNSSEQKILLNASYNNLVDWHISIDYDGVSFAYNRLTPPRFQILREPISRLDVSKVNSSAFEDVVRRKPSPNIPALDDALISTISLWKRRLASAIPGIANNSLSTLFNAIIFVRAIEDHKRKEQKSTPNGNKYIQSRFLEDVSATSGTPVSIFLSAFEKLVGGPPPTSVIDLDELSVFNELDGLVLRELISDFYRNKYAKYYEYDFSLMSKHALSRIYEHYVSELRPVESSQTRLFPALSEERMERSYGNVYTPEFIARFFAKYLSKQVPLRNFQKLKLPIPRAVRAYS